MSSSIGIVISHYKDPYQPISTMECHEGFKRCSSVFFVLFGNLEPGLGLCCFLGVVWMAM